MLDRIFRATRPLVPALLIGLLAAAPRDNALRVGFGSPAGMRPTGPLASPFAAVLPSGRILDPIGGSVEVGGTALGFAITPDGRYAVVSTAASPTGGDVVVVDTRTMRATSRLHGPAPFFAGVAAVRDPASPRRTLVLASAGAANLVYVFDLGGRGVLTPDGKPTVAIPPPLDERVANFGWAVPSTIVPSRDGRHAFVVSVGAANVSTIDLATRTVRGAPAAVGFAPFAAALTSSRTLLVANEGLIAPGVLATPARAPTFEVPPFAEGRASSLSVLPVQSDGTAGQQSSVVQMDGPPDGLQIVGGAHPSAIAVTANGRYAFVAMAGVDRVATVALFGTARVIGGTELRLYDRGPYGTQPDALAASRDGRRLYVALAGIDAVAVLDAHDPQHLHRLGLLPTGWQPAALSLSRDGRRLYVLNARGMLSVGGPAATLQRIDLAMASLPSTTRRALSSQRAVEPLRTDSLVPAVFDGKRSDGIKHVVLVLAGNQTFDAMLGDAGHDDTRFAAVAEPSLVRFGADVTPNLHALARRFALAGNLYNDANAALAGDALALGGVENPFVSRMRAAGVADADSDGIGPDAYPRLGYLFNTLASRHVDYRDYGVLLRVPGAVAGRYSLDAPALAALAGRIDLSYAGDDPRVTNAARAAEFARDYGALASEAHKFDPVMNRTYVPAFVSIRLPSVVAGKSDAEALADQDRALGTIVEFLSRQPEWESTAIFVVPEAVTDSRDHVDPHRSYALVVSPFAKRAYLGMRHLSTASVLKTEEEILGLPALSLADALSSDMSDFFTPAPDTAPYAALAAMSLQKRFAATSGE